MRQDKLAHRYCVLLFSSILNVSILNFLEIFLWRIKSLGYHLGQNEVTLFEIDNFVLCGFLEDAERPREFYIQKSLLAEFTEF